MAQDDRSPREIERDLEACRTHLDSTLNALQHRLDPGTLIDEAVDRVRRDGGLFGRNMVSTVRDNPVPATLMAVGLGWMMMSDRRNAQYEARYANQAGSDTRRHLAEKTQAAKERAGDVADDMRAKAHDMSDRAHDMRDSMTRSASDMTHRAQTAARDARTSASNFYDDNPIVMGLIVAAAGAALAALLPRSQWEDETLAPMRDEAIDRARPHAEHIADEAAAKAREATEAAGQSAREGAKDAAAGVQQKADERTRQEAQRTPNRATPDRPASDRPSTPPTPPLGSMPGGASGHTPPPRPKG